MKIEIVSVAAVLLFAGCTCNKKDESSGATSPVPGAIETVPVTCSTGIGGVRGNGQITRTTRDAKDFRDVMVNVPGDVEIQEGAAFDVKVETDANVQESITTVARGDALEIGSRGSYCSNKLHVVVTLPLFHKAAVHGSGKVDVTKQTRASDVSLSVNGSGSVTFRGAATALATSVNGSGSVVLDNGVAVSTTATVNGSGSVRKKTFTPGATAKNVNGSGAIEL